MLGKQDVCHVKSINKLYAFHLLFFPKRLLRDLRTIRLRPVQVYLRGRFETLFTPWVEHFCGDIQSLAVIAESPFLGIQRGDKCSPVVQCYFLVVTMASKLYCLFHLVFILLICYLQCSYQIQMHIEFNNKNQIRAFYRPTQRRIQGNF